MKIVKKRIHSLSNYLPGLEIGAKFYIAQPVKNIVDDSLQRVGFPKKISVGDSIVPKGVGPISEFNANGRDITRKDLPKVDRSYTVYTSWEDWHGTPHSGFQYRSIRAYPIEHISGPVESLTIIENNGNVFVASRALINKAASEKENLHIVNLFLEIFGQCEVLDENISVIVLPKIRSLNWQILPQGRYPWEKAREHFQSITKFLPEPKQKVIDDRLRKISSYSPDFIAIGTGGFTGYFVLGFTNKNTFVFESIHLGNATYIFNENWESLSRLTKATIIKGAMHNARIVHDGSWSIRINKLLQSKTSK